MRIDDRINGGDIQKTSVDVGPDQTGPFVVPNPAGQAAAVKMHVDWDGQDGAQFITSVHASRSAVP